MGDGSRRFWTSPAIRHTQEQFRAHRQERDQDRDPDKVVHGDERRVDIERDRGHAHLRHAARREGDQGCEIGREIGRSHV